MTRSIFTGREAILLDESTALPSRRPLCMGHILLINIESELLDTHGHFTEPTEAIDTALRALIRCIQRNVRLAEATRLMTVVGTNALALWADHAACISISGRLRGWHMGSFSVRTAYGPTGDEAIHRLNQKIEKRVP